MNTFKQKKLAEFDNNFVDWNYCSRMNENKNINDIKQFISDLIDEMAKAIPEANPVDWTDLSTPELIAKQSEAYGFNQCREEFLTNLNKI